MADHHPCLTPFALPEAAREAPAGVGNALLGTCFPTCPAMQRLVQGLRSLPMVTDISEQPHQYGAWCVAAPLWGNPWFRHATADGPVPLHHCQLATEWCRHAGRRPGHPGGPPATLGELTYAHDMVSMSTLHRHRRCLEVLEELWGYIAARNELLVPSNFHNDTDLRPVAQRLDYVLSLLPDSLCRDVRRIQRTARGRQPPATSVPLPAEACDTAAVVADLTRRMGWRLPDGGAVPMAGLTVKQATMLQMADTFAARRAQHAAFITAATGLPAPEAAVHELQATLKRLWRKVRWENHHKEAFWRLAVDGVPLIGNSHIRQPPPPCVCGAPTSPSPRAHHFWACPIAQAVAEEIALGGGVAVDRERLWLVQTPPGVQQCAWDVVCLAAVSAMEHGRRRAKALVTQGSLQRVQIVRLAAAEAAANFWGRLASFVAQGPAPKGWSAVSPAAPLIGVLASGDLVLNKP